MKVKNFFALTSEMRTNTQFKNIVMNFTKTDLLTKRLVLLPASWDKYGLLFKKRLDMMIKIIGYSQARTFMNSV